MAGKPNLIEELFSERPCLLNGHLWIEKKYMILHWAIAFVLHDSQTYTPGFNKILKNRLTLEKSE